MDHYLDDVPISEDTLFGQQEPKEESEAKKRKYNQLSVASGERNYLKGPPQRRNTGSQKNDLSNEDSQTPSQSILETYACQSDKHDGVRVTNTTGLRRRQRWNLGAVSRIVLQPEIAGRGSLEMRKKNKDELESGVGEKKEVPPLKLEYLVKQAKTWKTADVHKNYEPQLFVIYSMRDFVIFLLFLVVTVIVAFGSLAYAYNFYANVLSELLTNSKFDTPIGYSKTFKDIHRIPDIWLFINSVLIKVLHPNFDRKESSPLSSVVEDQEVTKHEGMTVLTQNILVGAPQMRQLRVKNDTCTSAPMFSEVYRSCYDYYHKGIEDANDFGLTPSQPWVYRAPDEEYSHRGFVSQYGTGGFAMNFTRDPIYTATLLKELEESVWIRSGTRFVIIDFTLYTPNANLFCMVELIFEIIPTGGVLSDSNIFSLKLLRYVTPGDYFIASCEIVFILFVIYYTVEEMQQIILLKESYLSNWWNILDLAIIVFSYSVIALGLIRIYYVTTSVPEKIKMIYTNNHASFGHLTQMQNSFNHVISILTFLIWIKLFKFLALNRSVTLILSTFGCIKLELVALIIMLVAVVMGFSILGHTIFGCYISQFRTLRDSFFSLIGLFVGGMYFYAECKNAAPTSAPIFFGVYVFFVLVLSMSTFIALIVHGFQKAANEVNDTRDRVYIGDVLNELCLQFCGLCRRQTLSDKLRRRQLRKLHLRDYEALGDIIRRHEHRGLNLQLLVKKYKVEPGERINLETMSDLYNDLTIRNQLYMEVEEHDKIMEQLERINRTIEFLDLTLNDIVSKVDILANKLLSGGKK